MSNFQYIDGGITLLLKIIGFKSGTGGSSGVEWLEKVTSHQFFPELWEIRNELS